MGLFSKKKKPEPTAQPADQSSKESSGAREELEKFDPEIRPGGVFMVQLLMKNPCPLPPREKMAELLSRHIGKVEAIGSSAEPGKKACASFAALDHMVEFKDGKGPVMFSVIDCDPFRPETIDELRRSQMWSCQPHRDRILSECKYAVFAHDMLGGGLPAQIRANLLMDYLEALLELYPECEAVYFINSGKLILADEIRSGEFKGLDRYIQFAVNIRFFNIQDTNDHVIDTLGLSLLFIEDLQYHFHSMDPNWVVNHACSMATYILKNNRPIKDGDTIDGITDGQLNQNIQWKCHFEDALIRPNRAVLDVNMAEYASGSRPQ